jgi:hypothetical protein
LEEESRHYRATPGGKIKEFRAAARQIVVRGRARTISFLLSATRRSSIAAAGAPEQLQFAPLKGADIESTILLPIPAGWVIAPFLKVFSPARF